MNFKKGLALFLCLAIFLSGGAGMAFASVKISAKLISMEGDVQVIRAGGEKPFKAFVNMRLTEGDRIITGSNGTAKVQMEDDVIITLAENTRIYLSELRGSQGAQQSSINLQSGAVGSSVGKKLTDNSRFEIKTPTAVMGVRGTEFFTQYYNGNVDVRVVNGTVEVSVSVTETGGVAGPGATAVQTYTFPVAALQQVNFGEQTPLSQLQQPPQSLVLIGLPLPFLDRVQEINQQIPGAIPQDVINTIDQAVQSAIQTTQDRMSDPNLSPSELESFIEGVIAGNLEASLPSFAPPGMEIPPLPPQISPPLSGGGGGDSGGDDGGTTPQPAGSITITSVTPSTELIPNENTTFAVTVAYSFSGISQAEIGIGFNTGEEVEIFQMIDEASHIVTDLVGTHTFEVSSMVKDWGEDGDFKVYVNISEVNHESSWTPLDFDGMVLQIAEVEDSNNLTSLTITPDTGVINNFTFDPNVYGYTEVTTSGSPASVTLWPVASAGTITINGDLCASGDSYSVQLPSIIEIVVQEEGKNPIEYSIIIDGESAHQLMLYTQPMPLSRTGDADILRVQPVVKVLNAFGQLVSDSSLEISATKAGTILGWTLGGTTTISAVNGIAAFTDLSIQANEKVLSAVIAFAANSSPGIEGTASQSFNIVSDNTEVVSGFNLDIEEYYYIIQYNECSLIPADNPISPNVESGMPLDNTVLVGDFLNNIEFATGATVKIANGPEIIDEFGAFEDWDFDNITGKGTSDNLAENDVLLVLAEDGVTMRGYYISLTETNQTPPLDLELNEVQAGALDGEYGNYISGVSDLAGAIVRAYSDEGLCTIIGSDTVMEGTFNITGFDPGLVQGTTYYVTIQQTEKQESTAIPVQADYHW
jgi:hypothetical protein